jgi:hypothetical protein
MTTLWKRDATMRGAGTIFLGVATALVLFGQGLSFAQPPAGGPSGRMYDPATVETVRGEVTAVTMAAHGGGRGPGVHVQLRTASGSLEVRLGPAWYLEREKLALGVGDEIEVTGSRVSANGQPALIARHLKKGDRSVSLRDERGLPLWRRGAGPPR